MPKQTFISFSRRTVLVEPRRFCVRVSRKTPSRWPAKGKDRGNQWHGDRSPAVHGGRERKHVLLNEGLVVGDGQMTLPLNQFIFAEESNKHTITVPATMMPFTMGTVDENGHQHFFTREHHGLDTEILSICRVLVVGAETKSHKAFLLNNVQGIVFGDKSFTIPAEVNPILSLRVGDIPHGFLYVQPYAIETLVRVLQHRLPQGYRVT